MLVNRRHPKMVFSTLPHLDPWVARRALGPLLEEMKSRFHHVRLWADKATDHPERYRNEYSDIPVLLEVGHCESFGRTSRALAGLAEIGQVRLYADVGDDNSLQDDIAEACRHYMA